MKKILSIALFCLCLASQAQTPEQFKDKYQRQVRSVGPDGVGVEYILNR